MFEVDLKKYFTPRAVANALKRMPPIKSQVMDRVYTNRQQHPLAVIGYDDIVDITKNVPVIRRGTKAFQLDGETRTRRYIEVEPIEVSNFISGKDLLDLKMLDESGRQVWVDNKIDRQRRSVRKSAEAMSALSLTGTIQYPMKVEGGYDVYEVDFGSIQSFTPGTMWDDAGMDISGVLMDLISMANVLSDSGYGGSIDWYLGKTAFATIAGLVTNLGNDSRIQARVTENMIQIANFNFIYFNSNYFDYTDSTWKRVVGDKELYAVSLDADFRFYYLALDDVRANLLPMPFYSRVNTIDNPSGYEIIGKSKPLPIPVPSAILKAQVIT